LVWSQAAVLRLTALKAWTIKINNKADGGEKCLLILLMPAAPGVGELVLSELAGSDGFGRGLSTVSRWKGYAAGRGTHTATAT
jgi:hypothetical protein